MKKLLVALFLIAQVSITAQDYKFGNVSKEELEEKVHPLDATADAAYLYRFRRTYYSYNVSSGWFDVVTEVHNRIKIYTKEGFEKATQSIVYYRPDKGNDEKITGIKGLTFNLEEGKASKQKLSKKSIFDEKKNKFRSIKKITLPAIKVGSVIDLKYKIISPYYTYVDDLQFQFDVPVKNLEYSVEIPEYYKFRIATKGYYFIAPTKRTKNRSFTYAQKYRNDKGVAGGTSTVNKTSKISYKVEDSKYMATNIPALKDNEPFVFNIQNHRGGMKYELSSIDFIGSATKYFSTTWGDVGKQIYKSSRFGKELERSNYYRDDLKEVLATTKTSSEKIAKIFQFVKNRVKWNGFNGIYVDKGVKKAYKERVGNVADINLMLTSMLLTAGLDAAPVLVSTRANGIPLFPTLDGFNYIVSIVKLSNGSTLLLDATELYSLPNILPTRALNWNGRKVSKDGSSSWVQLTPSQLAMENDNVSIKISNDLTVSGLLRSKYENLNALNYRRKNNALEEGVIRSSMEERFNIEIENFKIVNKNKIGKPISVLAKFISEDLIEEINDKLYLNPLLFYTQKTNPFKLEDRKFPVDFSSPWKDKYSVSIQIPEGYKVENIPESFAIGLPENLGVFKYQITQKLRKINTTCVLQFNSAIIAPQYYAVLKDFYTQLVAKQSEKIVLVKI